MILGGMALAFSRVIDNSVISLENIYRHLEMGAAPAVAAEVGGAEVNLAVLAATLVDVVDFFPVVFLYGVSKFLFSALALAFCLSLLASFVVAMTVIPLFCSRFLKAVPHAQQAHAGIRELSLRRRRSLLDGQIQCPLQPRCSTTSWIITNTGCGGRLRRPGLTVAVFERRVPGQPGDLSVAGTGILPADRCRPVHHQPESSHRYPHRGDRTNTSRRWKI